MCINIFKEIIFNILKFLCSYNFKVMKLTACFQITLDSNSNRSQKIYGFISGEKVFGMVNDIRCIK